MTDIQSTGDKDIDLKEIISVLYDSRRLISLVTGIFIICTLIYALTLPNLYLSESLVVAINDQGATQRASANVGSLVKMTTGINLASSGSMSNGEIASQTVYSRDFLQHLISNFDYVLPHLTAFEKFDQKSQSSFFDPSIYDEKNKTWVSGKASYLEVYPAYRGIVTAEYEASHGIIYMSVEHESPIFAHDFLKLIIGEVNSLRRQKDLAESKKALDYLYKESSSNNISVVQKSISQLITSQLSTQMMANIKPDYMIQAFDTPFIPIEKSGPTRSIILFIGTLLGLILSSIYVIIVYLLTGKKALL